MCDLSTELPTEKKARLFGANIIFRLWTPLEDVIPSQFVTPYARFIDPSGITSIVSLNHPTKKALKNKIYKIGGGLIDPELDCLPKFIDGATRILKIEHGSPIQKMLLPLEHQLAL